MAVFRYNWSEVPSRPDGGLYQAFSHDDGATWVGSALMNGTGPGGNPHNVEPKLVRVRARPRRGPVGAG